ncbi:MULTISPECIES: XRE family transcriptional regulator [Mycobacterium]|uniref:XRE family transcriptional regulator n=1 Tax=Mycobacterium TaxID=1763 RepID=UPI0010A954CE|nr:MULTISPECIES: XRE family transcriptional regulator [Mycobacterium]MDP7732946.1 XRE family transcriptional regulator [Mycobacterium sp. TY813]
MNIPLSGPARLDHFVSERLALLRMSRDDLSRRGGPERSTLHKAKTGSRRPTLATLTRLDESLGWARGSAAAILEGGEPVSSQLRDDEQARSVLTVVEGLFEQCYTLLNDARTLLSEVLSG